MGMGNCDCRKGGQPVLRCAACSAVAEMGKEPFNMDMATQFFFCNPCYADIMEAFKKIEQKWSNWLRCIANQRDKMFKQQFTTVPDLKDGEVGWVK